MAVMVCNLLCYSDDLAREGCTDIPDGLKLGECSMEALALRLLLGRVSVQRANGTGKVRQGKNYTVLPGRNIKRLNYKAFSNALGIDDIRDEEAKRVCDKYFLHNRRNSYVHERILNEISWYFMTEKKSPTEGFVHLYRCFEFISYSFPMIYAATSQSYKGTYDNLKKFMDGNGTGELKFFRNFLESLFESEPLVLEYVFEVDLQSSDLGEIRWELKRILAEGRVQYNLDEDSELKRDCFSIKFRDMAALFLQMRNRYFHMLNGSGQQNFEALRYDMNDLFRAFNGVILNWLAVIFSRIVQKGYELAVSYS